MSRISATLSRHFDFSRIMRGRLVTAVMTLIILVSFLGSAVESTASPGTSLTLPTASQWADLHGVNYGYNCPSCGAYTPNAAISFPAIAADGFNYVRYAWSWDAYNKYGATNFVKFLQYVAWNAEHNGVYIEFEMMDYSTGPQFGGSGFPRYVTAGYSTPYAFWTAWYANKVVVNGTDGWDAYLNVWRNVITHVDNYSSVIGYEPMNEPEIFNATSTVCSSYTLSKYCTNEWFQLGSLQTYLATHLRVMTSKWILFARPYVDPSCVTGTAYYACPTSGMPNPYQIVDAAPNMTLASVKGWGTVSNVVFAPHRYAYYNGWLSRFKDAQAKLESIYGSNEPLVPVTIGEWAITGYSDSTWNSNEARYVSGSIGNFSKYGFAWTYESWAVGPVIPDSTRGSYEYLLSDITTTFSTSNSYCASTHEFQANCPTTVNQWKLDTYLTQVINQVYGVATSSSSTTTSTNRKIDSTTTVTATTSATTSGTIHVTSSSVTEIVAVQWGYGPGVGVTSATFSHGTYEQWQALANIQSGASAAGIPVNWYLDGVLAYSTVTVASTSGTAGIAYFGVSLAVGTHTLYFVAGGVQSTTLTLTAT